MKELHHIAIILLINYLSFPNPSYYVDLIKYIHHNYKKIIIFNLTIKWLHHIAIILLINHLSIANPNFCLDLIKLSYHNYKKINYF